MFVGDYRPTKRLGVEELDGAVNLVSEAVSRMRDDGVAHVEMYEGMLLALQMIRNGHFEYPADFLAAFEAKVQDLTGGR